MTYQHITASERSRIEIFLDLGKSKREIARLLHRDPSTISREIRRNIGHDGHYTFSHARFCCRERRRSNRPRLLNEGALARRVWQDLEKGWSPDQIAGRMSIDGSTERVSSRTIYRHVRRLEVSDKPLVKSLVRPPRKKSKRRRSLILQGPFAKKRLEQRPIQAQLRSELGHWEGDTLVSHTGCPAVVVYVERLSRFTIARKLKTPGAAALNSTSREAMRGVPKHKRLSATLDNGTEFSDHLGLETALGLSVYFAEPRSPWQRPTVENTNGLIRHYLPKKMNLHKTSQRHLNEVIGSLNGRPRKCLQWRTPAEVFG